MVYSFILCLLLNPYFVVAKKVFPENVSQPSFWAHFQQTRALTHPREVVAEKKVHIFPRALKRIREEGKTGRPETRIFSVASPLVSGQIPGWFGSPGLVIFSKVFFPPFSGIFFISLLLHISEKCVWFGEGSFCRVIELCCNSSWYLW